MASERLAEAAELRRVEAPAREGRGGAQSGEELFGEVPLFVDVADEVDGDGEALAAAVVGDGGAQGERLALEVVVEAARPGRERVEDGGRVAGLEGRGRQGVLHPHALLEGAVEPFHGVAHQGDEEVAVDLRPGQTRARTAAVEDAAVADVEAVAACATTPVRMFRGMDGDDAHFVQ